MIYLDNNATTRPLDSVIEAMAACMREGYANASAITAPYTGADHYRRDAAAAMAALLNAEPENFVFTSGATESNNWVFGPIADRCSGRTVIISSIEHPSVTEPAMALQKRGFAVIEVPVDSQGVLQLDVLADSLSDDTAIVSIMSANNETGVIQPIRQIGQIIRSKAPKAIFHVDGTQSVGKIPVDLADEFEEVDLFSFSAHKFHGPKGIGGLFIRDGIALEPLIVGGGQENGQRSGTLNTPALVGLAVAAREAPTSDSASIEAIRDEFEKILLFEFPEAIVFSKATKRLPNTSAFSIPGLRGASLVEELASVGFVLGTGSACSSGAMAPSKTVIACAINYDTAIGTIRASLSSSNSMQDVSSLIIFIDKFLA